MKVVDANVLINAVNAPSPHHGPALAWLDQALSARETVGLPWISVVAFMRITTHPNAFSAPMTTKAALGKVQAWLEAPPAQIVRPGPRHLARISDFLHAAGSGGNLVNDAHIAAIAAEYGAEVVTFDRDFDRFPGIKRLTPS